MNLPNLIFDFDSTFVQVESLETLASISLKHRADCANIIDKMTHLTQGAMAGSLSFSEAISEKVSLLSASKRDIDELIIALRNKVTPSILRHKQFFETYRDKIYIISGGFFEFIWPVVKPFGIIKEHVFANNFHYDYQGHIIGFNQDNPLAQSGGKVKLLKTLNFDHNSIIIGDGYNDYELKAAGVVRHFFAFTENVTRPSVVEKADRTLRQFEDLLDALAIRFDKQLNRVLLLENIHYNVKQQFIREGFEVITHDRALTHNGLLEALEGIHTLGIRSKTTITADILEKYPELTAIGAFCIGTNQIDLAACDLNGVAVFNAPYSNTRSVVELALAEMICLLRRVPDKNALLHQGQWEKSATGAYEVRGKTLGIIGYGNIGAQLSILAESLGMHVCYFDVAEKLPIGNARPCKSMQSLLKQSDIVSLHVDGRPENTHLIGETELKYLKKGAILLNLSRGSVVHLKSLAEAIKGRHLGGAGLDVFPIEPESNGETFYSELQNLPNVILTPHIGGSTEEAQAHIGDYVFNRLNEYMRFGTISTSVNFPEIKLPPMRDTHRIIHIHENRPGQLAAINATFSMHKVNIDSQYLQTRGSVGYAITDIMKDYDLKLIDALKNISETKRVRVLY
ncbi:MAG: phosphoglycerate dehydrogenase [Gammaproteobacteria bacterium]